MKPQSVSLRKTTPQASLRKQTIISADAKTIGTDISKRKSSLRKSGGRSISSNTPSPFRRPHFVVSRSGSQHVNSKLYPTRNARKTLEDAYTFLENTAKKSE